MGAPKISDQNMIEALRKAKGFKSIAADALQCSRMTIEKRLKASKRVADAYAEITERNLDLAESKLLVAVNAGQPWAIKFLLGLKGGARGYRKEIKIESEQPLAPPVVLGLFNDGPIQHDAETGNGGEAKQ